MRELVDLLYVTNFSNAYIPDSTILLFPRKYGFKTGFTEAILRQKEIYNELTEERKTEIENLGNSVDRDKEKLIYKYKGNTSDANFVEYFGAVDLIYKIKDGDISLKRSQKTKLNVIKNVNNLYDPRQAAIDFFIEDTERVSEARLRSKQERKGVKILAGKQMLQRLSIALVQIKAGNNSQSLLNEIRQILYSLYQSKEIPKKVYNNIIKSIKV